MIHGCPLNWIALIAGSLHFLTQFISSHGPHFLFTILSILLLKKIHLDFLTVFLKSFQFSRLYVCWYLFSILWQFLFHQALECLVMLTIFECLNYMSSILIKRFWMISSKVSEFQMDEVFKFLILWMRFSRNRLSSSLPLIRDHLLVDICSLLMDTSIVIGAWSDKSLQSGWMQWLLNSNENGQRNTRSKMEFESWSLLENLVKRFSVGLEISSENESAISKRVSLWLEWKGKYKSHRLSLILKSPVIMIILWILTSVSLRYFKADWDESE